MSKVDYPFKQQRKKIPVGLKDLLKRSDEIHKEKFIDPEKDFFTWDHITGERVNHGDFYRLTLGTDLDYECKIECKVQDVTTGAINWLVIHYISIDTPKPKLLIIDLDAMCRAYDDENHKLIYALSTARPIKEGRLAMLRRSGEISEIESHNVKVELTAQNFPMVI